jgi:hypothetical protein
MKFLISGRGALLGLLFLIGGQAQGDEPMRYVYHPPESPMDKRYSYQWKMLETALARTTTTHGAYTMEPALQMTEKRQEFELRNATGKLTVMYLDTTPEFERDLIAVHLPVDKGLVGYRVCLIRNEDRPMFAAIESLDDLRKLKFGVGADWIDVGILRANRFEVVTGSSYDGLFEMLLHKRFDVFSRGANEVASEYEQRKASMPNLGLEDTICLYYPTVMYFWFSKTKEGARLAARVEAGMRLMIDDGTYDRIFTEFYGATIEQLGLKHRKLFRIANPFLGPETPLHDARLWFDPQTYRPKN